jgi:hypothetical protein
VRAATTAAPLAVAAPAAPTAPAAPAARTAPPAGSAFAVTTRLLRTRTESEQLAAAMRALLATAGVRQVQVEIVATGDDWRVIGWPFAHRDDAEKARTLLVARGMRVQVIDF